MSVHSFSFEGGEILTAIGASWFVSYAYYKKINNNHKNWEKVSTFKSRISKYNKSQAYHKLWLQEVIDMNPIKLNKNTIDLDANQTKSMAKELLNRMD